MRIFWSPILDFFLDCISLWTNKYFLENKFFDSANIGGVTKLCRGLSMRRSRWGGLWVCAKAAAAPPEHTIQRLWRILSIRPSRPLIFLKTLPQSECAWKLLRRALCVRGSHWGPYWVWAEAAGALTEYSLKPLRRSLSMHGSSCGTPWVWAKVAFTQPECAQKQLCTYMIMYVHDHIRKWSCMYIINFVYGNVHTWLCTNMNIHAHVPSCACAWTFKYNIVHVRA
jgi:hypothetical protein